jgi:hypothetical protein
MRAAGARTVCLQSFLLSEVPAPTHPHTAALGRLAHAEPAPPHLPRVAHTLALCFKRSNVNHSTRAPRWDHTDPAATAATANRLGCVCAQQTSRPLLQEPLPSQQHPSRASPLLRCSHGVMIITHHRRRVAVSRGATTAVAVTRGGMHLGSQGRATTPELRPTTRLQACRTP